MDGSDDDPRRGKGVKKRGADNYYDLTAHYYVSTTTSYLSTDEVTS